MIDKTKCVFIVWSESEVFLLQGKKVPAKFSGLAYFVIVLMIFAPLICIPGVALARWFGYCPYKTRGAAAIDNDEEPTDNIGESRMPLTSHEETPGLKYDNDEVI